MLTPYRRHKSSCKHRSRRYKSCACPIWVQGFLHGRRVRRSLDLTNWEAAARRINEMELHGDNAIPLEMAVERWLDDCTARNLKPQTIKKYREIARELKAKWSSLIIASLKVDDVRRLREGWDYSPMTMRKRLELVRSFFSFCIASGWLQSNPAKLLKPPKVWPVPTLPYSEDEWRNILTAIDMYGEIYTQSPARIRRQLKALMLLIRYSGLRISDSVSLKRDSIDSKGRVLIYTQKTGKPVQIPLPRHVLNALKACDEGDSYFFWSGFGNLKTALTEWQERMQKVMKIAGISGRGVAHRLRDTFSVDMLNAGVPLELVAAALGNSVRIVEKHYAPWVKSRQDALESAIKAAWV